MVRRGDAARGGGARAAAAPLPPVDGAPRPETVHAVARRWDLGRRAATARRWRGRERGRVGRKWGRARSRRRWSFQFFLFLQFPPSYFVGIFFVILASLFRSFFPSVLVRFIILESQLQRNHDNFFCPHESTLTLLQ